MTLQNEFQLFHLSQIKHKLVSLTLCTMSIHIVHNVMDSATPGRHNYTLCSTKSTVQYKRALYICMCVCALLQYYYFFLTSCLKYYRKCFTLSLQINISQRRYFVLIKTHTFSLFHFIRQTKRIIIIR